MKIGVISDTHIRSLDEMPKKALDILGGMDLVVHAGDYTGKELLDGLRKMFNFKGVYGNMDPSTIRVELTDKLVFEVGRFKIGVTHPAEGGFPFRLENRIKTRLGNVDVILYGHTHKAKCETIDNILFLNPGSLTGVFPATYKSLGVLTVNDKIKGEIIKI
ncbi:metallophosphoesterase [Candidatus Bathyarchaeota archaeon]|nr:MAG: metallophosphoesterase [Candidatus Bathyarchaeota archaeon]